VQRKGLKLKIPPPLVEGKKRQWLPLLAILGGAIVLAMGGA